MLGEQVLLVIRELRTELGMQIQVKQGRLSVTTAMVVKTMLWMKMWMSHRFQDLALTVDNVFQADNRNAFDFDVDEAPTAQTLFMANLSSADPVYDEVDAEYMSDSNMIPYDVKDNAESVVQNNVSSVPNDAYMMIINEMHEQTDQCVSVKAHNKVVDASLIAELATYKEQVELYKRCAKFELTEREQKIEEQLRIRKVAISYKNPLCLTRAKQIQPALYNGHEIIKTHHVPAIVHNSEDTIEIAEITRKKMNDKMKTPLWTKQNINIQPPDYSKENYLATFTPQTQLTPGHIFWSKDVLKMKAEALKEQTTTSRPIRVLTVYPPNTPAMLVPRVLPTKSQVKINIFALIQLFSEFEKTFKKRITPTCVTEGERGFEQTKEYYLTELDAEVNQNVMNRKHDEIERKNLLIANDNLIADCLSKEVFYIATNSELTVSRFTEMHMCLNTVVQALLALDFQITQLTKKVTVLQEQNELFRAKNAKIKQHYKELYDSIKITRAKHIKQTTNLLTKNENLKAQIHENLKCITMDSVKPRVLAPGRYAINVKPIPPRSRNNREVHLDYLKHLKESVETLREIVKEAKVERPLDRSLASACLYTKTHVSGTIE
ncbi:hypothetical protein Tco_0425013 [Tanacetum coccineum]